MAVGDSSSDLRKEPYTQVCRNAFLSAVSGTWSLPDVVLLVLYSVQRCTSCPLAAVGLLPGFCVVREPSSSPWLAGEGAARAGRY